MADESDDFEVVGNHAGHRSVWPVHRPLPRGWYRLGFRGARAACLAHIAQGQ